MAANKTDPQHAREYLEQFAAEIGVSYDALIEHAVLWLNSGGSENMWDGEYWSEGGKFEGVSIPNVFWDYFEAITGRSGSGNFFTCSC